MLKLFFVLFFFPFIVFTQEDTIYRAGVINEVIVKDKKYRRKYHILLQRVKRIYPFVLEAKKLFENYEKKRLLISKKRELKKFGRKQNKLLRKDFVYAIKELYRKDGLVLMKMIHSKTNHTVYEIIKKYRGKSHANWVYGLGKLFNQNLKVKFNPKKDYILDRIIKNIDSGKLKINKKLHKVSKSEYKLRKKKKREKKN